MMTGFMQAAVVGAGAEGAQRSVRVIQVSVDTLEWKAGQEKMYIITYDTIEIFNQNIHY